MDYMYCILNKTVIKDNHQILIACERYTYCGISFYYNKSIRLVR